MIEGDIMFVPLNSRSGHWPGERNRVSILFFLTDRRARETRMGGNARPDGVHDYAME